MKKLIIALVLIAAVGFVGTQVFARGYGHMGGFGMGGYGAPCLTGDQAAAVNPETRQQFLDETLEVRAKLAADQAELRALTVRTDSDPERIRALTQEIFSAREELSRKAAELGLHAPGAGFGPRHGHMRGFGGQGFGPYCQGYGTTPGIEAPTAGPIAPCH